MINASTSVSCDSFGGNIHISIENTTDGIVSYQIILIDTTGQPIGAIIDDSIPNQYILRAVPNGIYSVHISTTDNFGLTATIDNISIQCNASEVISGCTDPNAVNYNPEATQDDGTCYYGEVYTSTASYTATCPTNYEGFYEATVTRTSIISQEDADSKALEVATLEANTNLVCTIVLDFEEIDDPYNSSDRMCISYSPDLKSFTSLHNYNPHIIITNGDRLYLGQGESFEELNVGEVGEYFGTTYESSINIISNDNPLITKSHDNLLIQSTQCLSSIKVMSELKESITHNLMLIEDYDYELMDGELLVKYKSNQYQLALPRATDESRFKDKWVSLLLTYDNNEIINLKYISVLYRQVAR